MNQGFLAYVFTHFVYPVKPGDWCLIQAAAGGVGLLLCQMAKIRGGRVIGVTSTEEKTKFVREARADEVIISTQADIAKEARRMKKGGESALSLTASARIPSTRTWIVSLPRATW